MEKWTAVHLVRTNQQSDFLQAICGPYTACIRFHHRSLWHSMELQPHSRRHTIHFENGILWRPASLTRTLITSSRWLISPISPTLQKVYRTKYISKVLFGQIRNEVIIQSLINRTIMICTADEIEDELNEWNRHFCRTSTLNFSSTKVRKLTKINQVLKQLRRKPYIYSRNLEGTT